MKMFALAAAALLALSASTFAQTINYGIWRPVDPMDPIYDTSVGQSTFDMAAFETLVLLGPDNQIVPGQAESWEISPDGLTYTFHLREGLTWTDGVPVVAADYVAAFRRLVDPALNQTGKPTYLLDQIRNATSIVDGHLPASEIGVRAVDDRTVEFQLDHPVSYFLSILAYPGLVPAPRHMIEKFGEDWSKQDPLVSNGQLEMMSRADNTYVLRRRPDHWQPSDFTTVLITAYENNADLFKDLIRGELDIALGIPSKQITYTEEGFAGRVDRIGSMGTLYGVFNTLNPTLANPQIRRALAMLVDPRLIAASLELPEAAAGTTFTPPQLLSPSSASMADWMGWPMSRRIDEARRILGEAGYTEEAPLQIEIASGTFNDYDKIAIGVRSMWSQGPVEASLKPVSPKDLSAVLRAKTYDFAIAGWYGDYPDPLTFLTLLDKQGSKNNSAWSDLAYSQLLDAALAEPAAGRRVPLYLQMERMIAEQAPLFAIIYPELRIGLSPRVESYRVLGSAIITRSITLVPQ